MMGLLQGIMEKKMETTIWGLGLRVQGLGCVRAQMQEEFRV